MKDSCSFFSKHLLQNTVLVQVVYNGKEVNHPFGITHHLNYVFWTDYMNGSIFQLNLQTGQVNLMRSERPPLFGLRVYDAQSQQGEWLFWACPLSFTLSHL